MAADLISEIIDQVAIDKQLAAVSKKLADLAGQIKGMPVLRLNDGASYKELTAATRAYENSLKDVQVTQKKIIDVEKVAALERKRIADERTQQARLEKAELQLQQFEIKKKAIAEKEAAIASKQASAEAVAAGRERIIQLKAEQAELERLATEERNRGAAEQQALSGNYNPGTIPQPKASGGSIPLTIDQGNIVLLKTYQAEIEKLTKGQKLSKDAFQAGKLSLAEYSKEIATSTQKITGYKANLADLSKEMKLSASVNDSERNSLQRAQALINQYTNEKKKLNLATEDGRRLNENYNKAIQKSNAFLLKNADAETQRTKNIGNYGSALNKVLGPIRTLANILPGLGISGIFLGAFEIIKALTEKLGLFNSKLTETKEAQKLVNDALDSSSYKQAVTTVNELTINIGLAKEGLLSKKEVLKQYNETIGKTTGQLKSFDEAEQALIKNGEAYVKMTLYKAAANLALDEAAKSALKAEQTRRQSDEDFKNSVLETKVNAGGIGLGGGTFNAAEAKRVKDLDIKARKDRKEAAAKVDDDAAKQQLDIAKKFQKDAAAIASGFKFNFFGDEGKGAEKSLKKLSDLTDTSFNRFKRAQDRAAQALEEQSKNEQNTYDQRLSFLNQYLGNRLTLVDREEEEEKKKINDKLQNDTGNLKKEAKKKNADIAGINKEIQRLTENANDALLDIEDAATDKRLAIFRTKGQREIEIQKSVNDSLDMLAKEKYENELQDAERSNLESQSALSRLFEGESQALSERFQKGEIQRKEFDERRAKLEFDFHVQSIRNELAYAKQILDIQKAAGIDTIKQEEAIQKLASSLEGIINKDGETDKEKQLRKEEEYLKKKKDLYKQLYAEIKETIFQFLDDSLKREEQNLDDRKRLLDEDTKRRLSNIDQLGLSEIERVKQKSAVEKNAQFQTEQIEKRKRAIEVQRAKFERAASIASIISSTAQAIVGALAQAKTLGLAALPLAAVIGAIGALQLARAISTPLPKYKTGRGYGQDEFAVVGDGGVSEYVVRAGGSIEKTPATPTVTYLNAHDRVFKDQAAFQKSLIGSSIGRSVVVKQMTVNQGNDYNQKTLHGMHQTLKNIERKSGISIHNTSDIKTSAWYKYHFKN